MKAATDQKEAAQAAQQHDDASRAEARRRKMLNAIRPTADEDAAITAAALSDPDNPPMAEGEGGQLKPARRPRGRPAQEVTKEATTMRLDGDVLDAFKATGDGWQTRVNAALRQYVEEHGMQVNRYRATVQKPGDEEVSFDEFMVVAPDDGAAKQKVKEHLRSTGRTEEARGEVYTDLLGGRRLAGALLIR